MVPNGGKTLKLRICLFTIMMRKHLNKHLMMSNGRSLPTEIVLGKWRLVHAGYNKNHDIEGQPEAVHLWIRKILHFKTHIDPQRTILFGHTVTFRHLHKDESKAGQVWFQKYHWKMVVQWQLDLTHVFTTLMTCQRFWRLIIYKRMKLFTKRNYQANNSALNQSLNHCNQVPGITGLSGQSFEWLS